MGRGQSNLYRPYLEAVKPVYIIKYISDFRRRNYVSWKQNLFVKRVNGDRSQITNKSIVFLYLGSLIKPPVPGAVWCRMMGCVMEEGGFF